MLTGVDDIKRLFCVKHQLGKIKEINPPKYTEFSIFVDPLDCDFVISVVSTVFSPKFLKIKNSKDQIN